MSISDVRSETPRMTCLSQSFYARDAVAVAKALLGKTLTIRGASGKIVETEAYTRNDAASHSFRGPTQRNDAMFGLPGTAYVYRSYGIHWCLNVVCNAGDAVLLRALEPLVGLALMAQRRGTKMPTALCSGPGKLGQAFDIRPEDNARAFQDDDFSIQPTQELLCTNIVSGPRIGISQATGEIWRFGVRGSAYLSRKF